MLSDDDLSLSVEERGKEVTENVDKQRTSKEVGVQTLDLDQKEIIAVKNFTTVEKENGYLKINSKDIYVELKENDEWLDITII